MLMQSEALRLFGLGQIAYVVQADKLWLVHQADGQVVANFPSLAFAQQACQQNEIEMLRVH